MKYAIQIDSASRIEHATFAKYVTPANADKYILVDTLPTGETEQEKNIRNYFYIDEKYIYDPLPEPEQPEPAPSGDFVWDELDGAYQAGYQEGYTEGVNSAYDQ